MSRVIVEIKVFDASGNYKDGWTDITSDVIFGGIGDFTQKLDNDAFNAGVLKNSSVNLQLSNEHGRYSEVGEANSIFSYTRNNSLVRFSWNPNTYDTICGIAICGEQTPQQDDVVIFTGLLNDDSLTTNLRDQKAKFKLLGKESVFSQVETPYTSLSNGDTFEEVIYTCLNQTAVTNLLTVDTGNIDVGTDQTIDDKTDWENTTIKEVLDDVLEASGSVLYIEDDTIYVKGRTQSPSSSLTFYGQASNEGLENIQALNNIKSGINKMFNYWTWEDTTEVSQDTTSVDTNGIKKKEVGYDFITNSTKQNAILDYNLAEFKDLQEEFQVTVLMTPETLDLQILDGVTVDYPTVFVPANNNPIPLYGVSIYGTALYPTGEWTKTFDVNTTYKVMGKKFRLKKDLITFYLREI